MEIGVVDQRYQAVMAVLQDGWKVSEVAEHFGVARQTVHRWIPRHNDGGVLALTDGSHRPHSCSHQIPAELEALICEVSRPLRPLITLL